MVKRSMRGKETYMLALTFPQDSSDNAEARFSFFFFGCRTGGRLLSSSWFCNWTDRAAAKDRMPWMRANSAKNIMLGFQF